MVAWVVIMCVLLLKGTERVMFLLSGRVVVVVVCEVVAVTWKCFIVFAAVLRWC